MQASRAEPSSPPAHREPTRLNARHLLWGSLLLTLLLAGCSKEPATFVGYTYQVKSYSTDQAVLVRKGDKLILEGGPDFHLEIQVEGTPQATPLPVAGGTLTPNAEIGTLEILGGEFTLQSKDQRLARGNFDLTVGGGEGQRAETKVVGSFDARPEGL